MAWQLNGDWLERIPVLQKMSRHFLVKVALNMSTTVYAPREKPPAQRLYVIIKGFCTYGGHILKMGEHWGQRDMAKTKDPLCATAISYLHVNYVATQTIVELAENFDDDTVLRELKKWTLFQKFREHAMTQLKLQRKRVAWRETYGEHKPFPANLQEKALKSNNMTIENRMGKLAQEVDQIKQTLDALCEHLKMPVSTKMPGSSVPQHLKMPGSSVPHAAPQAAPQAAPRGAASHRASIDGMMLARAAPLRPVLPAASAIGALRPLPLPLPPVAKAARPAPPG